jgi:uncharacterized protein YdeI (YjbR/CyaY-like superfamily)
VADLIFFTGKDDFIAWFETNPDATELYVGYHRKSTKRPTITWSDSVDVALWYGWIDGVRNSIDDECYKIRFTPRKINSVWSAVNVNKVQEFIPLGLMKPAGLHVYNNRNDAKGYTSGDRNIPLSPAYEAQIKATPAAWDFLTALAPSYRRDSIWWVMSAKKEETQLRRLAVLIESSADGLKIPSMRKK